MNTPTNNSQGAETQEQLEERLVELLDELISTTESLTLSLNAVTDIAKGLTEKMKAL